METVADKIEHQRAITTEERLTIRFIKEINALAVSGRSTGLEVLPAYIKLIEQVEQHFTHASSLKCYFHYTVINASTTKLLFNLFKRLTTAQEKGHQIEVYWLIDKDDEELIDIGLDFKNLYDLDFKITVK